MKMKKMLSLMLAAAMTFSLAACGEQKSVSDTEYYALGDTVSTDIIEFTLDKAELAIALNNIVDENFGSPKEFNPQEDKNSTFVAPKGHTYATFTYKICNLDRTTYSGTLPLVTVEYKDEISNKQVDVAEHNKQDNTWTSTGNNFSDPIWSWGFVLDVGEERNFRSYVDIPVEADNLTDEFMLTIELPVSDGTTSSFTYKIN